jgi:carbon starvation protein
MSTLLIAIGSFVGFFVAYHTYGRWLARKVFQLDPGANVPSCELRDDVDYVPTRKEVIFGHHFTSIAGTGPIVGPAIAVFWGWLPALIWVLFGCVFIGAVHDFGALVVSLRNRGQTVGQIAGRVISPRARMLFLLVLFFCLTIVLAIFGLVIASIFKLYPESVLSVWIAMPIAVAVGLWVYRGGGGLLWPSLIALVLLYLAIYVGAYYLPIELPVSNPIVGWTLLLMVYCFFASVLPVWVLLQPRDFVNSHQLVMALVLLVLGIIVASIVDGASIVEAAPAVTPVEQWPIGALPLFPFLFITIACGAVSGFHCLVSSGTSSKQVAKETDAQYVGYGSMLLEGALAVVVILACCAGVGMGKYVRDDGGHYQLVKAEADVPYAEWRQHYKLNSKWSDFKLPQKVGAFVEGGANFLHSLGIPLRFSIALIAVLVASFAATTLDTATRLQRYVIQEIAGTLKITPFTNKYAATLVAVLLGGALAMLPATEGAAFGCCWGSVLNWGFERRTGSDGRGSTAPGRVFVLLR